MSLPKPDLHLRISEEANASLELLAEAKQRNKSEIAALYLEEALLGRTHNLRLAAMRFTRMGISGTDGD